MEPLDLRPQVTKNAQRLPRGVLQLLRIVVHGRDRQVRQRVKIVMLVDDDPMNRVRRIVEQRDLGQAARDIVAVMRSR